MGPHYSSHTSELDVIEQQRVDNPELAAKRGLEYVKAHPQRVDGYLVLGRCFADLGREPDAVQVLRKALELDPGRVDVLVLLGNLALYLQQVDEAGQVFERAMQISSHHAAVHLGLGRVAAIRGSMESAQTLFAKALSLDPTLPGVTLHFARSRRFTVDDKSTIASLEVLLRQPSMSSDALSDLHFALGKISDDCGDYDLAFEHYEQANRLVASTLSFDRERFGRSLDLLTLSFSSTFFEMVGNSGQSSQTPVFIVGMPRSGTTLVEQILSSHSLVHGAGELPYIDQLTREFGGPVAYPRAAIRMDGQLAFTLSESYLQMTRGLSGSALRIADKMPTNYFHLGFIASLFPRAHIIHCRRNPLDTCLSVFFQQFETGHEWAYELSDIAFFYQGYKRIMAHWANVLPVPVHEIHYQNLISEPENTARQLVEFCGLLWEPACLSFHQHDRSVLTSSAWQVRQPLYSQSVDRWKRYDSHLDTLRRELHYS